MEHRNDWTDDRVNWLLALRADLARYASKRRAGHRFALDLAGDAIVRLLEKYSAEVGNTEGRKLAFTILKHLWVEEMEKERGLSLAWVEEEAEFGAVRASIEDVPAGGRGLPVLLLRAYLMLGRRTPVRRRAILRALLRGRFDHEALAREFRCSVRTIESDHLFLRRLAAGLLASRAEIFAGSSLLSVYEARVRLGKRSEPPPKK
jgi:DNA-directed RNA polymerase specialized sigma24 family protein